MTRTGIVPLASSFTEAFAGTVITPADERYDAARAVWNGAVEATPALIAQCHTAGDIVTAVNLVRAAGCRFAVRAGGHSVAGLSTCDDGVVIDLSQMRDVTVNAQTRTATVAPGATWADFDAAAGAHGLASTGGLISTTGVAGLTLGGVSAGCSESTDCRATTWSPPKWRQPTASWSGSATPSTPTCCGDCAAEAAISGS